MQKTEIQKTLRAIFLKSKRSSKKFKRKFDQLIISVLKKLRDKLNQSFGYGIEQSTQLLQACLQAKQLNQSSKSIKYSTLLMIEALIQAEKLQARDIMIPRSKMIVINKNISKETLFKVLQQNPHSRFPIVSENKDRVIGILMAKDVLNDYYANENTSKLNLRRLSRPVKVIPESKRLNFLLKEFRNHRNHMAIVVNEFGETAGLITIEDVLEQIVGDIRDEHDNSSEQYYLQHKNNLFTIRPTMPIKQLTETFKLEIDLSKTQSNTVGGWIIETIGYLPKQFEKIMIHSLQFRILRADQHQIRLLELIINPPSKNDKNNENNEQTTKENNESTVQSETY